MGRIEAKDWFYNGWYEIFKVYLHSRKRMANPLFYEDLLPIPTPLLFQIFSTTSSTSLSPPTPILTVLSVVLFLWLNSWSHYIWCAILLNDNMDLHILSLGTRRILMCVCVFYATKCQVTEFWQVMWVFTGTHSFFITYTNTQTYIAHSGASRLTHS